MKALVIGAGMGGLSTALSFHQAGFDVTVFESVRTLEALGVGITLQPHAVRELTEMGLGEALAATGIATSTLAYYNKHGQLIWSEPRGRGAGYRWPQYSIHRGNLQMLMLRAAQERLGAERIRTGHHLVSFQQDADGVTAHFVERRTGRQLGSERADLLVAADGIHSVVRQAFYPREGPPTYCGQMMYRAGVECAPYLDGRTQIIIGHRHCKFLSYPIEAAGSADRQLINWIAEITVDRETPPRADWNRRVPKEAFAQAFEHFRFPWIDVPAMIEATGAVYEFPKADRDPVERWSFGRVTLLGDAAHAMLPIGGQAGSQAIVDPRYLTRALLEEPTVDAALRRYEAERLPAMNAVTLRIREQGQEQVMEMAEARAPHGFADIEEVIPRAEMEAFSAQFKAAAGLDRDNVNSRPSLVPTGTRGDAIP